MGEQAAFEAAIKDLGTPTRIDFEDYEASPSDTISGRPQFDPRRYASRGFVFLTAPNAPLYVAPGGLFWNPTNSVSVGRFPFDSGPDGPFDANDDLEVSLDPGCSAVAFSVLDKGDLFEFGPANSVEFVATTGLRLRLEGFPATFLGYVSPLVVRSDGSGTRVSNRADRDFRGRQRRRRCHLRRFRLRALIDRGTNARRAGDRIFRPWLEASNDTARRGLPPYIDDRQSVIGNRNGIGESSIDNLG